MSASTAARSAILIFLSVVFSIASCTEPPPGADDQDQVGGITPPPTFEIQVDSTVVPTAVTLETYSDGVARPVGAVTDDSGVPLELVENELIIVTSDAGVLNAFVARWNGTVLATYDPAAFGMDGSLIHLVRIETSLADRSALSANLSALNPNGGPNLRAGSEAVIDLIAAGSSEAASGLQIGLNFVPRASTLQDRNLAEGPTASRSINALSGGYSEAWNPNPFSWSYMQVGGIQNIGVAEAWRTLERARRLGNKVKIAIVDGGFADSLDYPLEREHNNATINALDPTEANQVSCTGGSPCPWHGTNATDAAMARVDNGYGAAGPAGPVARALTIRRTNDVFNNLTAVGAAVLSGANIINMSFSARVPATLSWSVIPFDLVTLRARGAGKLLFAAAGNDGENIDEEDCFIACWEAAWITPCENGGVTCVGALDANSRFPRSDSNWGAEELDIYGPGFMWVGPDPGDQNVHVFGATSGASPFVAGVAALIWAANPGLSNDQVEQILYETANVGTLPGHAHRWPNAQAAVVRTLGNTPPELSDVKVERVGFVGRSVSLTCQASDVEDGTPTVIWTSNLSGELGRGTQLSVELALGTHTITCTAIDSGNMDVSQSVVFTFSNNAPRLVVQQPREGGASYYAGQTAFFEVSSFDIESGQPLPNASIVWSSNLEGTLGTGNFVQKALQVVGAHTVTVRGTDADGLSSTATASVGVEAPPPDGVPPTAYIYSFEYDPFASEPVLSLAGVGQDKEDGPLSGTSLAWTIEGDVTWNIPGGVGYGNFVNAVLSPQKFPANFAVTLTATDSSGKTGSYRTEGSISPLR